MSRLHVESRIEYIIKVLNEKLESIPVLESAERFEPGTLSQKLEIYLSNKE